MSLCCPRCTIEYQRLGPLSPILTPCLHTFCLRCVQEVAELLSPSTFVCPKCQSVSNFPVADFPINHLESRKNDEECFKCGICENLAFFYCPQCPHGGEWLCANHTEDHARQKVTRDHQPVGMERFEKGLMIVCSEHGQSFKFFCDSCSTPICNLCSENHVDHKVGSLHDFADLTETLLCEKLTKSKLFLETELEPALGMIEGRREEVGARAVVLTSEIDSVIDDLTFAIRALGDKWKGEISSEAGWRGQALGVQAEEVRRLVDAVREAVSVGETCVADGSDLALLATRRFLDGRLDSLLTQDVSLGPCETVDFHLADLRPQIESSISNLNSIIVGARQSSVAKSGWNLRRTAPSISISSNVASGSTDGLQLSSAIGAGAMHRGVHSFAVKLDYHGSQAAVGICNSATRSVRTNAPIKIQNNGSGQVKVPFGRTSTIGVIVNVDDGRVFFHVDRRLVGECSLDLAEDGPYFPMVTFFDCTKCSATLLELDSGL